MYRKRKNGIQINHYTIITSDNKTKDVYNRTKIEKPPPKALHGIIWDKILTKEIKAAIVRALYKPQ